MEWSHPEPPRNGGYRPAPPPPQATNQRLEGIESSMKQMEKTLEAIMAKVRLPAGGHPPPDRGGIAGVMGEKVGRPYFQSLFPHFHD